MEETITLQGSAKEIEQGIPLEEVVRPPDQRNEPEGIAVLRLF